MKLFHKKREYEHIVATSECSCAQLHDRFLIRSWAAIPKDCSGVPSYVVKDLQEKIWSELTEKGLVKLMYLDDQKTSMRNYRAEINVKRR